MRTNWIILSSREKNRRVYLDISERLFHCVIVKPVFVVVVGLWRIPEACWEIISGMPALAAGEAVG